MAKADSSQFLVEQSKALLEPLPVPPQRLDEHARTFWPQIIASKRRDAWTPADLLLACQLCRDLVAIEILHAELVRDGWTLQTEKSTIPHPAAGLMDAATRRILANQKHLHIHPHATQGRSEAVCNKNQAARDLAEKIQAADSLIPRPLQ